MGQMCGADTAGLNGQKQRMGSHSFIIIVPTLVNNQFGPTNIICICWAMDAKLKYADAELGLVECSIAWRGMVVSKETSG